MTQPKDSISVTPAMIEAAAIALYEQDMVKDAIRPFDTIPPEHQEAWRRCARAALRAALSHAEAPRAEDVCDCGHSGAYHICMSGLGESDDTCPCAAFRTEDQRTASHAEAGAGRPDSEVSLYVGRIRGQMFGRHTEECQSHVQDDGALECGASLECDCGLHEAQAALEDLAELASAARSPVAPGPTPAQIRHVLEDGIKDWLPESTKDRITNAMLRLFAPVPPVPAPAQEKKS